MGRFKMVHQDSIEVECERLLEEALSILSSVYGLSCNLSCRELLDYLSGPTYEDEGIAVDDILCNELLVLHEAAEACILKSWGYKIGVDTVMKAYPHVYLAHLRAMEIELSEARRREEPGHIENRCRDLHAYLEDPYLPSNLVGMVRGLIAKYCRFGI